MSKEDVVKRLKALQEKEDQMAFEEGKQAGREWAERQATPKELRRLQEYITDRDIRDYWWNIEADVWMAPYGAAENFVFALRPYKGRDQSVANEFWEEALGDTDRIYEDSEFLRGFGEGASEVWDEVEGEL